MKQRHFTIIILFVLAAVNLSGQSKPLRIELGDLVLTIPDIAIDLHYYLSVEDLSADSVLISLELGDTPLGYMLVFHSQVSTISSVKQRYETSITVMDEGPHLDLINWKHYFSPWVTLKMVSTNQYQAIGYSQAQSEMFPEVNIEEVRRVVKKLGGERWLKHIEDSEDIHTYPLGIGISKVEFVIEYEVLGKLNQKVLIFDIPLGC